MIRLVKHHPSALTGILAGAAAMLGFGWWLAGALRQDRNAQK